MKYKLIKLFVPFLTLTCNSCRIIMPWETFNPNTIEPETKEQLVGKHEMFLDTSFENGFLAIPGGGTQIVTGYIPEDRYSQNVSLKYGNNKKQPVWTLRQNNDVYNLNDKYCEGQKPDYADGCYIFYDQSKKLIANPIEKSLYMELDSSVEYGNNERTDNDLWAHMLIASSLERQVAVSDIESLTLNIDIQMMINIDKHVSVSYTDEMILYLQLSTSNQEETEKADKPLWFGIPFFNSNSSTFNNEYAAIDKAQGANSGGFIYKFAANKIYNSYSSSLIDGNKHTINIDLISYFETALQRAHSQGFWTLSTLDDLVISDMNFGFELPSKRKIGVQFSNLSLVADYGELEEE